MDELKLRLSTKFMRGLVAKLISKAISKKLGYKINIELNAIDMETQDGVTHFRLDVEANVNNDELRRIVKDMDLV